MNKSPEDYFKEQDFSVQTPGEKGTFTPAERAFMEKYMGVNADAMIEELGLAPANPAAVKLVPDEHKEMSASENLDTLLREQPELLMVAFYLGSQEFTVPTCVVQEVIRTMPLAKLPSAPPHIAGVINLRGKVTPIIKLRDVLEVNSSREGEDKFIVVCRRQGIQIGMIIERIHTMYRIPQSDIDWTIEARLGINVEFIAGLLKLDEQLIGIISMDRIVESILA